MTNVLPPPPVQFSTFFQSLQILENFAVVLIIAPLFVLTRPIFVYWLIIGNAIGLITIVMLSTELFTINSCRVAVITLGLMQIC